MLAHEAVIEEKDVEIASLTAQREISRVPEVNANSSNDASENRVISEASTGSHGRRGKAPPVDSYTGSDPELRFDDWLPTLERAAQWNSWSDEEK